MLRDMEQQIREAARRVLPSRVRKPLGRLGGIVREQIIGGALGLFFDLKGGKFKTDGCTFQIPKDITSRSFRSCFLSRTYEKYELELIPRFLRSDDRVLELGACIGVVSCVTNKVLSNRTQHVVVEANPFCLPALYRNRELNKASFLVENCAVGAKSDVTFYLHRFIVGGSSQKKSDRPVRLPAKTLGQLDRERGPFNVLIIDIEGSELEVFEDSVDLLKTFRLVVAELHDWAIGTSGVERCREILRAAGLRFVERGGIVEVWQRSS